MKPRLAQQFAESMICSFLLILAAAPAAGAGEVLRMRLSAPPATLDWTRGFTAAERPIFQNIMEGLFELDATLKPVPVLVKAYSFSRDRKTCRLSLRTDVLWSDGKPVLADDFVNAWQRLLDPKQAAAFAYLLYPIRGAERYNQGKSSDFSTVGIRAENPQTLVLELTRPAKGDQLFEILSAWATFPVRGDLIARFGEQWSQPGKIQVVGPYLPVAFNPGSEIILVRNPRYFGTAPSIPKVSMSVVSDDSTATRLFRSGKLDYVRLSGSSPIELSSTSAAFHSAPALRSCFLVLNPVTLSSLEIRRIISSAVNRAEIAKALNGRVSEATTLIPAAIPMRAAPRLPPARVLSKAHPSPVSGRPLSLLVQAEDRKILAAQILQQQLQRALGTRVELQSEELKMYIDRLKQRKWDMAFRCWNPDFPDAESYLGVFQEHSPNRFVDWHSKEFEGLIEKGDFRKALEILESTDTIIVPLYTEKQLYLLSSQVLGFSLDPVGTVRIRDIHLHR